MVPAHELAIGKECVWNNNLTYLIMFGYAVLSIFSLMGMPPARMFTSLSIVAAAIAILSKDFIADVISGMIISFSSEISIDDYVKFGPFYLAKGPLPQDPMEHYIMTPSVETKLKDLARIILTRKFPVLIEGPTSAGKTSSIEYLAKQTGHEFIRINNHEHTDIQEYIGSYVSDPTTGKLVFKDGLLVQALRKGSWIVLDELNLAPTG